MGTDWQTITNTNALPAIAQVLSRDPNPEVVVRGEAKSYLAIVQFVDGVCGALCAGDPDTQDVHFTLWAARQTKRDGKPIKLTRYFRVSPTTFRAIVVSGTQSVVVEATGYDEMDAAMDALFRRALDEGGSNDLHFLGGPATTEIRVHRNGSYVHFDEMGTPDARNLARAMYTRCAEKSKDTDWTEDQPMRGQMVRELWPGRRYAIRFQSQNANPDAFDLTMRLLPLGIRAEERGFADLGFLPDQVRALHHMLNQPRGMIAMVGPTGSGKSTTLKTQLEYLLRRHEGEVKIQTLEDPVEYEITGVRQANVTKAMDGESQEELWERALSTLMRMKPDIVMLGEIRNSATARIGVMLNRTGHKLLTSFHADDVFSFYDRLEEFGIPTLALIDDGFVAGVVRQQLLPLLCPKCAQPYDPPTQSAEMTAALHRAAPTPSSLGQVRVRAPEAIRSACEACSGTGHKGQTVLAEILVPDAEINDAIARHGKREAKRLWRLGKAGHLRGVHISMLDHGLIRVFEGRVSPIALDRRVQELTAETVSRIAQEIHLPEHLGDQT